MGRPAAMTKLGEKRVNTVRCMGGNLKYRALRLDTGNFAFASESCTRRVRILDVMYNASNNELLRTKTLVKNAIVQIDASAFRQYYEQHYGISLQKKSKKATDETEEVKKSKKVAAKLAKRAKEHPLDRALSLQFEKGRLLACISSRPGQCGRADGYILEGEELAFYQKKMAKK